MASFMIKDILNRPTHLHDISCTSIISSKDCESSDGRMHFSISPRSTPTPIPPLLPRQFDSKYHRSSGLPACLTLSILFWILSLRLRSLVSWDHSGWRNQQPDAIWWKCKLAGDQKVPLAEEHGVRRMSLSSAESDFQDCILHEAAVE